jgi:hypothetical protein
LLERLTRLNRELYPGGKDLGKKRGAGSLQEPPHLSVSDALFSGRALQDHAWETSAQANHESVRDQDLCGDRSLRHSSSPVIHGNETRHTSSVAMFVLTVPTSK